jgi:Rrf2 family protein
MTLLSRKADYALLILSYLHKHPAGASAREIAEGFNLSRPFVANILKELCQKGFVASHRGVKGGYALLRPAGQITLAELLESLDEEFKLATCSGHHPHPADDGCLLEACCPVKGPIGEVHRRIAEVLRGVSLAELFQPAGDGAETIQSGLPLTILRPAGMPAVV